ncbi:PREDICTED: oxygen-regulated protein 1 [Pygoscelis adeliae]|uniref:oxygen-regulated protein 1 n=1 Tax=Pygoscelis adeliae TaxID=9238 RepID=UPI0004F509C2|nr:PREDICTED: oxygen-regulated protein 1 [Pygoscelis adeliae]
MSESPSTSYSVNQPNSSESEHSSSMRLFNVTEPVVAKRICFYKSGDPQFNGIKMVINNRSYKTFDALLDSLSKRVPLPFGVRNISTPKGRHSITNLEDLEDGKSYICSHQRKMKPINLEQASKKPLPWQISRPVSAHGFGHRESKITTPKKMLVFKNGDVKLRHTIVLGKKNTQTFEAFLDYMSEIMQYPVVKLYTTDGRKVPNLQALILCSGAVVAAGREPFKPKNYQSVGYSQPAKLLGFANRVYPKANAKSESENTIAEMGSSSRSQIFTVSSDKGSSNDNNSNDNNSDSSYVPDSHNGIGGNQSVTGEDLSVAQYEDDIEKSVHLNQDGSITVEMKVRFKIKEAETIKWTTTVSHAGLSDDKNTTICNSAMHAVDCLSNVNVSECIKPEDAPFLKSYNKEESDSLQQFNADVSDTESESDLKTAGCNSCKKNNSADLDVSNVPEDNIRPRFYRPPTPGPRRARQKKALVESVTLVSEKDIQEKTIEQFSYSEEIQNRENKSEYCMVAHSSRKKSSVSNPKFSEMSDNDLLKLSSENVKEEMLFKVSHKNNNLIETTNRKTVEVPDKDELVQNILEKSVVEQDSVHSACPGHSQMKMMVPPCSTAPIEKINPTTGFFPTVTKSENQISVRTESVRATHLIDDSQSVSSLTEKKKKRKSSDFLEQGTYENQKDKEISGIIKSEGMHITSKTAQDSTTEAMDNYSEMPQEKGMEFFVKNNDGSVNSDKSICPEDEFYHQDSVEQNGLLSNKKPRSNNNQLAKKEKKQKGMKKNLSKGAKKLSMSERAITVEALNQEDFQEEVVEHSLENYVQTWLKNLLPNSVLPPINKKEGNVENNDVCHFPKENTDASIDKQIRFITNKVHVTGKNHLVEHNLTKKTLKPICELGTLEESAKDSGEKQTDSLIHANTNIVEEAKYSLKSELHHDGKLHLFHETHDNDKKKSEVDIQDTNPCQRKKSEVAVQVDCAIVNEEMGIDVQNNCMSSMLLHELQSTLLGLHKEHSGCIGKACSLSDLSPSAFGSSSNVLLAWLLVLNLKESLIGTINDDIQKTTCSCSEIFTQLQFLKQTAVIEKVDELKAAFSHFQQSTENNLPHFGRELKKQDSARCHENMPISEIHNGKHLHENEKSVEPCIPKDSVNSEEALKLAGELENCFDIQKGLCRETETLDLSAPKTQLDGQYANTNSNTCSLASAIEPPERNEEMPDSPYKKSQDKNTDASFIDEESGTSVEPNSTVHSITSNDKNRILDQDTSELEGEKDIIHVTADKSEDEKVDPKSAGNDKNPNNQLKLVAETSVEYNNEDYSVQEDKEDAETCEETSERLSTVSPLSFCYESKQITECDMSEGEQKLQVEELENKTRSDTSQLKKCLKSPATSDWSDYRPDTEESDYNFRASSDLTNDSGEEAVLEKHYNTGYVKRTIERLYGKTEASFKPDFHKGFPCMLKVFQKDTEEFHSAVVEKTVSFSQEPRSCSAEKLLHSSLPSQGLPVNRNKHDIISRRENTSLPTPQHTLNREETSHTNDRSGESPEQHCQPSVQANEDEGILIDKGKWLLKENHLIRRSPPERIGMYGNLDTTSTDTVLDTNSDDVPYSHFGNLNQYPVLNEISSSELEDMAKPSENFCNYFNIPHNSDSDPFQDDLSIKTKPSRNGKITALPAAKKEKIKPSVMVGSTSTHLSTQADTNFPAFTTGEFRLPGNKVHPLEQPLNDEPIQSQPTDVSNANRSALQEEDSLDKLHAICGQHCPILMVTVTPINEEQRGYAYQKASDIENQLGPCLLAKKSEHLQWSGEDLITDKNNHVTLKNNCINKIANNIFNRFYANNTLDFISNFGILASSTLKNTSSLGKLHVVEARKWKVSVLTSDIPSAGTSSKVYITLYGDHSSSGPIFLDGEEGKLFQRGNEDIFTVNTGNIGHLYKIRIGHTNAGNSPAWHCEEVQLLNLFSGEEFSFPAHRWLAWDQADGEISMELPVLQQGQPILPVTAYEVHVTTGELWNAGTEADVYISVYGERGDTGSRQLLRSQKPNKFLKGQTDIFAVEAVHLGHLYKIVIGHNGLGSGNGWFLDKVVIKDPITDLDYTFLCHRWLDQGQDDGNIARELTVTDASTFPGSLFDVNVKGRNICIFSSHQMPRLALALVNGHVIGKSKDKTCCELCVHLQPNGCAILESARNPGHTITFNLQGKVADETTGYAGLSKEFVVHVKGIGDEYCHFKIEKNLETGSVSLESVQNKGIYVGLLPDGQTKPVINTGERNIFFYPQVIKFGWEKPMGTSAAPNQEKKDFRESKLQPAKAQKPVSQSLSTFPPSKEMRNPQGGECPPPSDDEWKVSMLTGSAGTQANVVLWIYGDRGVAGPITLGKDNRKQLFLPRQEDEFQVKIKSIGNIYKIRIELDGLPNEQSEWNLQRVILQHLKSKKTLNFPANTWLSKNRDDRDFLCELPVVEAGKPVYPIVLYHVYVYTGDMEQADTDSAVYLCIYGKRGDSGLRLLHKSGIPLTFQRGMVSAFEVEAVSLGELQKVLLRCEANAKSQYWYCDKVIVRETEKNSEYVFNCARWLPFMSQGVIHSEIELYPQEGDWKITVVTGDFVTAGTTATVSLYAYGENKASGPIILGSGKHQMFNPNSEDTFKINLRDLGQLYKIRIGHDNTGNDPSWYLEEVRLERVVPLSDEEICLPIECWLAEDKGEGDTWREVAIRNPTKELLPLLVYEVHVYTGAKLGAETDSNVFINLIGTRGDTGKRKLHRSKNNNVKFRHGQMDIFCIKAVSLGDLEKVLISHDGAGPGNGWFLDKIVIKQKEGKEAQEVAFHCNRWLDEYQDDGKTERELTANKNGNLKKAFLKAQQWRVQVKTDGDSPEPQECKRTLVIYGSKGKSDELLLSPQTPGYVCFLPRATDEFIVETGDLGDVYKIRVSCDDVPGFEGWHLKSFHLEELHTKQELNFDCKCWLSLNREDKELVKEFPAVNEDQKTLPVYKYVVSVHIGDRWEAETFANVYITLYGKRGDTVYKYVVSVHIGDRWEAETFANVYITLYGKRGDTGVRKLHTSLAEGRKFQRNKVDSFLVEAVSLSHLQKVVIGHDREGYGAGMYLKMVTVKESQDSEKEWVFPWWDWLDTHLGLCETVCEIVTVGRRLISSPKLPEINMKSSGLWIMDITGSDLSNEEDPICLSFIFYGNLSRKKLPLQVTGKAIQFKSFVGFEEMLDPCEKTGSFNLDWFLSLCFNVDRFILQLQNKYKAGLREWEQDELADIGSISKVQVTGPHSELKQPWHLDLLHMKHTGTKEEMYLAFDCWFNPNEDKCVELPALYADQEPLPVVEYAIHLHTGHLKKADATGEAYLCIQGEKSDSGKRWLNSRNSLITFARGQVDVFKIKAVYLGKLNQVLVGFKSQKKDEWFLEKIVIKEVFYTFSAHVFVHNDWINKCSKKDFVEVAIPLKETSVTSLLTKDFDIKSRGRWQTWVHCTQVPEDVPDIQVVVFGRKGKSPAQEVQNLNDNPFLLTVGDIGDITKVSFVLSGPCLGRAIKLHKLRLKDLDTKQELGFHTETQWLFGEDGSETVTELAAVRPDKPPLRGVLYSISVHTGTLPASGTHADVFITVFGEQGDSCKRRLRHSNFERGQVLGKGLSSEMAKCSDDTKLFKVCISEMRAVDLGQLSKVLVEHHNIGYGAGWYLDKIVIRESGKADGQYAFLCQQWLDSGVGDAQTERMLKLLGKVRNGMLTGKIYGTWDVLVTTSDISSSSMNPKMCLTVCGEKGTCTSVIFPKGSLKKKQIYETSVELNKKFNTIFKVRLEIEEAGEGETWHCREVKLQHRESKNVLEFPFCRNFADEEGGRVAELPVLTAGSPFPAVKSYVLYVTTGAPPGSGTDADVYVMLQGLLGDTGRRKLIRKGDDNFTNGKVDVFQVEAVDIGTLQGMVVEKGKGSDWLLEKIIVKESAAAGRETLFMAQTWLKDRRDGKRSASSFLVIVDAVELGELDKVVLLISSKTDCKLDIKKLHLKEAVKEHPIYVFEVNEAFSVDANKPEIQREIPVSFVIRGDKKKNDIDNNLHKEGSQARNLTEYTIKVYTGDKRGAGTDANVHIILFGYEDKSEVFQLSQSLEHQDPFERGKVDTFKINTKKLGSLHSIEIGHDGKGFASGWFLEKVEITDASRNSVYCFNCNRWLAEDESDGRTVVQLYP